MEKLIVISAPDMFPGEHELINRMFASGLGLLHLRKPGWDVASMMNLLDKIDNAFHNRIAVHQHHDAARDYGIRRLHFPERERHRLTTAEAVACSASVHSIAAYKELDSVFSYAFYSPVFKSISKKEHTATIDMTEVSGMTRHISMVALGGIDRHNCLIPFRHGFDSVAVLGAIWETPDPLDAFKNIQVCITTDPQC